MKRICFAIVIAMTIVLFATGCTSSSDFEKGKRQLERQGYTHVENTGYSAFCCSGSDDFSTGFKCKDRDGNTVTGCFCSGVGKGITTRFE